MWGEDIMFVDAADFVWILAGAFVVLYALNGVYNAVMRYRKDNRRMEEWEQKQQKSRSSISKKPQAL